MSMNKRIKVTLKIEVTYDLNGADPDDLVKILGSIPGHAAGEGLMSGNSAATVKEWTSKVIKRWID